MELSLNANVLAEAAQYAGKAVNPKPNTPVLGGLLLETMDGVLRVTGRDYDGFAQTQVAIDSGANGAILVPARMFTDIVRKMGAKTVHVTEQGGLVTIKAGTAQYRLQSMDMTDYPQLGGLPPVAGTVDGDEFADAVAQVQGAAATDPALASMGLTGILVHAEAGTLTFTATDRYRIGESTIAYDGEPFTALVKAPWLAGAAKQTAGQTTIHSDENTVGIRCGNRASTTTLMGGDFPKVGRLYPDRVEHTIAVDKDALAGVIDRLALVTEHGKSIRLEFTAGELTVESTESGNAHGNETIPAEYAGTDPIVTGFQPQYLAWAVANTPGDVVVFGINDPTRAILITPTESPSRKLAMPIKVKN